MRIAIDARLNAYRQGGIPQYTRQLMTALADVATDDQIISFQHRDQLRPLAIAPNVTRRTALTPPHHRFEQWTLPLEVLLARADVLHCPDFIAPTRRHCPAVVTIHDLAFMHYPEILDAPARAFYSRVTTNAPRADAIIAVSEATRQDIAQFLDIPIEQIDVIHEAAAPLYTQIDLREGEARVLNSTPVAAGTFMLFVSTLEPRKNLPTLLQALRICLDRRPDAGYRLVIVGRRGWRDEAIFQTARDLKLADHVLFTGGVGQYDLRWLYNACRLYINPSLYEGFGLPLLEAMACGAPCLAAATSSLPEIGGSAAIYVPPLEAEQWADEIMALWDDEDRRAELSRLGLARAQQFSWVRAARETLKVYRRAVDRIVPRAEPAVAPRLGQAIEHPGDRHRLPAADLGAIGIGAPRPCLRCGTALRPGDLQLGVQMWPFENHHEHEGFAPRMWACPRCGYVELVAEPHPAEYHPQALDSANIVDRDSVPPVDADGQATGLGAVEVPLALEQAAATVDPAPTSEAKALEAETAASDTPAEPMSLEPEWLEADASASADGPDTALDRVPAEHTPELPGVFESDALARADSPEPELDSGQGDVAALVDLSAASADDPRKTIVLPILPSQAQDEPIVVSDVDASSQDDPRKTIVLPMLPSQAQDDPTESEGAEPLDHAAALDAHAPSQLAGPLPDAPPAATLNGTPPKIKPRSGRGSRRQSSPTDSASQQPPKRRSSGSKRKQSG
ncbi:MAG TPA: glycosyltransferase [Roseiflexaceae bacterium]|nr:glycosyltransferase [Roseiflexaceae bacterium]